MNVKPTLPSSGISTTTTTESSTSSTAPQPELKAGVGHIQDAFEKAGSLVNESGHPAKNAGSQDLSRSSQNAGLPSEPIQNVKDSPTDAAAIKAMEDRISKERDAAWMNFGFSIGAAGAASGAGAAAGAGSTSNESNAPGIKSSATSDSAARLSKAFEETRKKIK